jgi:hypothetical protein
VVEIDDFGISLGSLSVGLPPTRTDDDVYARYLELLRLSHHGGGDGLEPTEGDVAALAVATSRDPEFVLGRLSALR